MSDQDNTGKLLSDSEVSSMQTLIQAHGLAKVAKSVCAGEQSVTKAVAKIPVQRGTIALIRAFLANQAAA